MNNIDKTVVLENDRKIHYTQDVSKMLLKEANKMLAAIRKSLYDGGVLAFDPVTSNGMDNSSQIDVKSKQP